MIRKGKKNLWAFLPALALMVMIFVFSAQPADDSSDISEFVGYKIFAAANSIFDLGWGLNKIAAMTEESQHTIRKIAHFTEYLLLAVSLVYGFAKNLPDEPPAAELPSGKRTLPAFLRPALPALLIGAVYAAGDEIHQQFVPGRNAAFSDTLIDCAGVLAGILLSLIFLAVKSAKRPAAESMTGDTET